MVNKNSDLNIYKDNDLLLNSEAGDQKIANPPCCGMKQEHDPKAKSDAKNNLSEQLSATLGDIDFNDWVGRFSNAWHTQLKH
jgi:hypothetical protein